MLLIYKPKQFFWKHFIFPGWFSKQHLYFSYMSIELTSPSQRTYSAATLLLKFKESCYFDRFCPNRMEFFLSFHPKKCSIMVSIIHFFGCFDKNIPKKWASIRTESVKEAFSKFKIAMKLVYNLLAQNVIRNGYMYIYFLLTFAGQKKGQLHITEEYTSFICQQLRNNYSTD